MKTIFRILIAVLILITLVIAGRWALAARQPAAAQARLIGLPVSDPGDFKRADGSLALVFPRDHGPHPDYQTEWWYYTGNLESPDGRHFGYQLTFFRRSILSPEDLPPRPGASVSKWATSQVYLAHFAISDIQEKKFQSYERFARGAVDLAGAQGQPSYQVWLEDWQVREIHPNTYQLQAGQDGWVLDLTLIDAKGPILQGDRGYSLKGPNPGNASYYTSQTRLETSGTVTFQEIEYPVHGLSWMDHEFSTSSLSAGRVGWDWFALQLDDGSELMIYNIRQADGTADPYSSGTLILADGTTRHLQQADFEIRSTGHWKSPHSGGEYPSGWRIQIPSAGIDLEIDPLLKDQENNLSFVYWEGAVRIQGQGNGRPVWGVGYVELTGYTGSMAGQF